MSSVTEIYNMALGRLGAKRVNADTSSTPEAVICREYYEHTRKLLLRSFRWPFARKDAVLSEDTTTPVLDYDHAYIMPPDYLRLLTVNEQDATDPLDNRWTIKGNRLQTNYDTCSITYIRDVTVVNDFDVLFSELLALTLAKKIAPAIVGTKSPALMDDLYRDLKEANLKARTVCLEEINTTGRDNWNLARFGG